jgi:hypothetical protein
MITNRIIILAAAVIFNTNLWGQITVTNDDYNFQFSSGNKLTEYYITNSETIDAGSGSPYTWDFSSLVPDSSKEYKTVPVSSTPFRPDYPRAQIAFQRDSGNLDWQFYCRSIYFVHLHGLVYTLNENPGRVKKLIYDPIKILAAFPLTINKTWKDTVIEVEKIFEENTLVSTEESKIYTTASVNAYGTIVFPGGKISDALMAVIKETIEKNSVIENKLYIRWYTKSGEYFSVETDPASPAGGIISVKNIKWMINSIPTGVYDSFTGTPADFLLQQNYPNPFNPVTNISFKVPYESDVVIKVYDIVGREVAYLVNERRQPGSYNIQFDGSNLSSGIYLLKMSAGSFNQTMKMTLLK